MAVAPVPAEGETHPGIGLAVTPVVLVMRGLGDCRRASVLVIVRIDLGVTIGFVMKVLQITGLIFRMTLLGLHGQCAE